MIPVAPAPQTAGTRSITQNGRIETSHLEAAWLARAMVRVTSGDAATFKELYERTEARLFGICLRILVDRFEAEDALQEIYVMIWLRAGQYDQMRGAPMTWMTTIARNHAIDRKRSSCRMHTTPIEIAEHIVDGDPLVSEVLETQEEQRQLSDGLKAIDPLDALLIRTAFFEGSTHSELADRTGLPLGSVKSRIRRALPKLRSFLP